MSIVRLAGSGGLAQEVVGAPANARAAAAAPTAVHPVRPTGADAAMSAGARTAAGTCRCTCRWVGAGPGDPGWPNPVLIASASGRMAAIAVQRHEKLRYAG